MEEFVSTAKLNNMMMIDTMTADQLAYSTD